MTLVATLVIMRWILVHLMLFPSAVFDPLQTNVVVFYFSLRGLGSSWFCGTVF